MDTAKALDINSPLGRFKASQVRDMSLYCKFHPQIHPDNVEDIRLKKGIIEHRKNNGELLSTEEFMYCPRCFIKNPNG